MQKRYIVADVHGMCGGVFAALDKLDKMLLRHPGEKVFVLHELIHNTTVTKELEKRGAVFVDSVEAIPPGAPAVIGAHGVSRKVENAIRKVAGSVEDATCPLVRKLHQTVKSLTPADQLILFGNRNHPEVSGVLENSGTGNIFIISSPEAVALLPELDNPVFLSQTSMDADRGDEIKALLRQRFANLRCGTSSCEASRQRQAAVIRLAEECQIIIVAGSAHSSNASRLKEVAERCGVPAYLVNDAGDLPVAELANCTCVGVTSGASTPEYVLEKIILQLQKIGFSS